MGHRMRPDEAYLNEGLWKGFGYPSVQAFLYEQEKRVPYAVEAYLNFELRRLYNMANRKKAGSNARYSSGGDGWQGYANIPLSDADKDLLRKGVFSLDDGLEIVREMLATGHKISLTYNAQQNNVTASATGVSDTCRNKGYTLTAFANDFTDALTVIAYKHQKVAAGDWSAFRQVKREPEDFG